MGSPSTPVGLTAARLVSRSWSMSSGRTCQGRHGRVPAVAGDLPLQPIRPLLQRGVRLAQLHNKRDQLIPRQLVQP